VRAAQFMGFGGIESGVNAAKHNVGAAFAGHFPNFITAKRVGGVDANTDDVPGLNLEWVYRVQSFIDQTGIAKACGRRCGQHIQPARSNDSRTERNFAWIDQMNAHSVVPSLGRLA
jgi:hypothetical protein